MIAVLKQGTSEKQIENLTNWLHTQGIDTHISFGKEHTVIISTHILQEVQQHRPAL